MVQRERKEKETPVGKETEHASGGKSFYRWKDLSHTGSIFTASKISER